MKEIKIPLFVLGSFFGIEDAQIAANKTTITIHPENKEITIFQEDLFTIIQSENDTILALEQWKKLNLYQERKTDLIEDLDNFTIKKFTLKSTENTIQPNITLRYSHEKDLHTLGIWYSAEKNQFSVNQIPQYHIKSNTGKLAGNYWVFNGENTFSFTIEPFLQMPDNYQEMKLDLQELVLKKN